MLAEKVIEKLREALDAVWHCTVYPPCETCGSGQAVDEATIKKVRDALRLANDADAEAKFTRRERLYETERQ